MPSNRIKVVFFDAAGTLIAVNGSVGGIYARLAGKHAKQVTVKDLEAGFRRSFASAPPMAFPDAAPDDIPGLEKKWWRALVQQVFSALGPFPAFDEYFEELYSFFAQADAWQLYPETVETLETLHTQGATLGVISNFDSRLFGLLDGLGIGRFFDSVVISTQAGAAKPQAAIFRQALTHHGFPPEQAVHVGDSYERDIVGAQEVGIIPVLVDRRPEAPQTNEYLSASSLLELPDLLQHS